MATSPRITLQVHSSCRRSTDQVQEHRLFPTTVPAKTVAHSKHQKMAFSLLKNFLNSGAKPKVAEPNRLTLERRNAKSTSTQELISIIERDGGVIVEEIISTELAARIKNDLKPYFDTDKVDPSGFFPETTQRASGLLGISDACVELACNKTYIGIANEMLTSEFSFWNDQRRETVRTKPIISSTVGFRVNPGGRRQALHRDDR